jgi:hypothetical protein
MEINIWKNNYNKLNKYWECQDLRCLLYQSLLPGARFLDDDFHSAPRWGWCRGRGKYLSGKNIPLATQKIVEKRIQKVAKEQFQEHYVRPDIRFRGQFCYIDAYTELKTSENWPPAD